MSMSLGPDLHLHCSSAVFQELERHHCLQSGKRESWCKSYKNEEKKEGGKEGRKKKEEERKKKGSGMKRRDLRGEVRLEGLDGVRRVKIIGRRAGREGGKWWGEWRRKRGVGG